jgi:hypothetical protein
MPSAGSPELCVTRAATPSTLEHIMSDPIAQAAEALSAAPATEPVAVSVSIESKPSLADAPLATGNVLVNETPTVEAPNVAPAVDAGAQEAGAAPAAGGDELPRESHLMLLEHKLAAMHAKFKTGERIVIDEFEQILGHIRAVL